MVLMHRVSVRCEGASQGVRSPDQDCQGWVGQEVDAREAHKVARRNGWKRVPSEITWGNRNADLCPLCAVRWQEREAAK